MKENTIQVEWKLPQMARKKALLTIPRDITVRDLLHLCISEVDNREILVVINGRTVLLDDMVPSDGRVTLLPVLCGG
jgi:hypothetical protein